MDKPNDVELRKFAIEQAMKATNVKAYEEYYHLAKMFYEFLKEK